MAQSTPDTIDPGSAATQAGVLPLHETTLIGLMIAPDAPAALIRLSDGRVARIRPGDIVGRRTVAAIDADGVVLVRGSRRERLRLPGQGMTGQD